MRLVIQRVSEASVTVDGTVTGRIGTGLMILCGIEHDDTGEDITWLVPKVTQMRIFSDPDGKMNLSVKDIAGGLLVVSQFTLHASTKKGNRPSFIRAARPEQAIPLYEQFIDGADLLDGGDNFDTADYSNNAEKPTGTEKTLNLNPPNNGITIILDNFSEEGIDFKIIDRYGDMDSLVWIEKVVAQKGQTNTLDIRSDSIHEIAPFTFEINGTPVQFENINRIIGDTDNQSFNLYGPAGLTIDGGGLTDTDTITYNSYVVWDMAGSRYLDETGTYSDTLTNIENVTFDTGRILADVSRDFGMTLTRTQMADYSGTNSGATIQINADSFLSLIGGTYHGSLILSANVLVNGHNHTYSMGGGSVSDSAFNAVYEGLSNTIGFQNVFIQF